MVRLSTLATSTLTSALKVLSTVLPDSTFFSLERTTAPPLPGLWCWNQMTCQSWPSRLSTMPFFRSFVVAMRAVQPSRRVCREQRSSLARRPLDHRFPGAESLAPAVNLGLTGPVELEGVHALVLDPRRHGTVEEREAYLAGLEPRYVEVETAMRGLCALPSWSDRGPGWIDD